jgi:hypothetical protein
MFIYIDPMSIQNFLRFKKKKVIATYDDFELNARSFKEKRFIGLIVEDDAIKTGEVLKHCPHFKGTMQRFHEKLDWHETNYKKLHTTWYEKINNGKHKGKSFEEFYEHRLAKWDRIFNEIKTKGYKKSEKLRDNVEIAINKRGEFLLIDGRHRVAFAQILKLKKIPVVVNIVSENLAKSFADEDIAKSFSDRNLAKAFTENKPRLTKQLHKKNIKERLAIATKRTSSLKNINKLLHTTPEQYIQSKHA